MSADFTPTLDGYKAPSTFRFWCQHVLPLVYDDSLSYYELLCKVVDYINKLIDDNKATIDNVDALLTAYNQLQQYVNDYFDNLNVQQEINNKLDDLAQDGTLTALISAYLDPIVTEQNERITAFENTVNADLETQTEFNNVTRGMLANAYTGPYPVSAENEIPDGENNIVWLGATGTGASGFSWKQNYWYYTIKENGTLTFVLEGGLYQAAGVQTDKTLTIPDMAADAQVTGQKITGLKEDLIDIMGTEFIVPIEWTQGRLSTAGLPVATNFAIRSNNFIPVIDNRRSISVLFGDYAMPSGATGVACVIYEYSSTDPVTLNGYYEYINRDGNFIHEFSETTVAFKMTLRYLASETFTILPKNGYLVTTVWTNDGFVNEINNKQDKLTFDNVPTLNSNNPVKSGGVYTAVENLSATLKTEPFVPIAWEQGRLSSVGELVASNYAIRSNDFIPIDSGRNSISVLFGNYDLPNGSTGLSCYIFEYSSLNPVTINGYYQYINRDGNFTHTFDDNTVAFKITLSYLATDTFLITPDKGYLATTIWTKDGFTEKISEIESKHDTDIANIINTLKTEPIVSVDWEQGRLSTSGLPVASNYAIRSRNFISVDNNRNSITGMFGNYELPAGATGLSCYIFEYSSLNPVTINGYYQYINRDGNFTHTFDDNTVAFKITLSYLAADTYALTPDNGYLINPVWAKDGLPDIVIKLRAWEHGKCNIIKWEQGRLTISGDETSAPPSRIRTQFIDISGIKKLLINAPDDTQFGYYWYDSSKTFISADSYIMGGVKSSTRTIADVPNSAFYLRLVVGKRDNSDITPVYGNDITVFNFDVYSGGEIITNPPMLTIMDDDGYRRFYTDLYTILGPKKVPATSAVIVGNIGLNNYLTWSDIEEMYQDGMEFISHTYSHIPDTSELPQHIIANDYQKGTNILQLHGIDTHDFGVIPRSSGITPKFREAAKHVYKAIFVNGEVTNYKGFDPYSIRRYKIGNNTTTHYDLDALKALIDTLTSGWMIWGLHTSSVDGWVPGTDENSSAYIIGQAVDYALSKGIPIVTAEAGFRVYSTRWNNTQVPTYIS